MVEVLFTNLEFLKHESAIKGRVSPGALVFCLAEGLLTQATMQGTGFAFLEMDYKIEGPDVRGRHDSRRVRGDRVASLRRASRKYGLVRTRNHIFKQDGKVVLTYTPLRMVKARSEPKA